MCLSPTHTSTTPTVTPLARARVRPRENDIGAQAGRDLRAHDVRHVRPKGKARRSQKQKVPRGRGETTEAP